MLTTLRYTQSLLSEVFEVVQYGVIYPVIAAEQSRASFDMFSRIVPSGRSEFESRQGMVN